MTDFDVVMLAIALAMDCFAVSVVSGVILRRWLFGATLRMSLLFGLFQAFMPLLGWLLVAVLPEGFESLDHWAAFIMLSGVGGNMIKDSFKKEADPKYNPLGLKMQLMFAAATSIDAFAVGVSFACLGYGSLSSLLFPLVVIGAVSTVLSIVGMSLGVKWGNAIAMRFKPELVGGIILIVIGVKILLTHILEENAM